MFNVGTLFTIRTKGTKENVNELLSILKYEHPDELGFYCVYDVEEETLERIEENEGVIASLSGECDGSVEFCMFDREGGFYDKGKAIRNIYFQPTHIINECKKLNLEIEIYSKNFYYDYIEHFHIKDGIIIEERFMYIKDLNQIELSNMKFKF